MTDRPVIVGFDGSEDAVRSVEWAAAYSRASATRLEIVHAYDFPYLDRLGDDVRGQLQDEAESVARAGLRIATDAEPSVEATAAAVMGEPAKVLVERAADAALLVVGHHGLHRGLHRMLGSTAARCVHHAPCPVIVMR